MCYAKGMVKNMNKNNIFVNGKEGVMNINGQYWRNLISDVVSDDILMFNSEHIKYNMKYFKTISNKIFPQNICAFAVKVAPHEKILETIKTTDESFGVEVYNLSELNMALKMKCPIIVVDGYYKPYELLKKSVENDVFLINVDSFDEIKQLNDISEKLGKCVDIGIRIKENQISKMGISINEIRKRIAELKTYKRVNIVAVHMHPGSNRQDIVKTGPLYSNLLQALDLLVNNGICIKYIDIGGGYGEISNVGCFLEGYLTEIKDIFLKYSDMIFILEPGRALVSDAGILFSKVTSVNHFDKVVNLGIALSPFLCTTSSTLELDFPDYLFLEEGLDYSIAGIWPISSDIITQDRLKLRVPKKIMEGDYVAIYNAGAYVLDRLPEYSFDSVDVIFI